MEKKPLVTLVILLLVFALVAPIIIFKATGLTMVELASGKAIPQVTSYVKSISFVTIAGDTKRYDVNRPEWLSVVMDGPEVGYNIDGESPTALSSDLDTLSPKDKSLVFARERQNYLYAGHYFGEKEAGFWKKFTAGIVTGLTTFTAGTITVLSFGTAAGVGAAVGAAGYIAAKELWTEKKPIEVGARVETGTATEYFDFPVPGFLTKTQGFSGDVMDEKASLYASKETVGKLKAYLLGGEDFVKFLDEGTIEDFDINKGWNFEKLPQLGWSWSMYGVFRVPVTFEFWAEGNPAYVPGTVADILIKVPKPLPLAVSTANTLLPGYAKVKDFEVVGLYNGYPLLSSGLKDTIGIEKLQAFEPNLFSGVFEKMKDKIDSEWGVTAPKVERARPGTGFGSVTPKLEFKPNIDINIWRRKVSVNPTIDLITVSDFFQYKIEQASLSPQDSSTIVGVRVTMTPRPEPYPFTSDGYNRIKIKFEIPIAWTATVTFNRPDSDKLTKDAQYWYDNVLRGKLGWDLSDIQSRLKDTFNKIKSNLSKTGINVTALETALTSWFDTILKHPDIPPVPDVPGALDDYRREAEENMKRLQQESQEAIENLRRQLEAQMVSKEVMDSALENERKKWEAKLAEQQNIFNVRYSELENKLKEMEEKARTVTNFLLDSSEQVQEAPLPSLRELWGKYAMPIREVSLPVPAELPEWQRKEIADILGPENFPIDITFQLVKPIGQEVPDVVTYETKVPEYEEKAVNTKRPATAPYERPYGISDYAKDAILMVAVVLGSVGAGILALRVLRKR
jgi:hypothetical protein